MVDRGDAEPKRGQTGTASHTSSDGTNAAAGQMCRKVTVKVLSRSPNPKPKSPKPPNPETLNPNITVQRSAGHRSRSSEHGVRGFRAYLIRVFFAIIVFFIAVAVYTGVVGGLLWEISRV